MAKKIIKKLKRNYWITWFIAISIAYFIWLSWSKLTDLIGNSDTIWFILLGLIVLLMVTGWFKLKGVLERFK